jgi:hypothetical protein
MNHKDRHSWWQFGFGTVLLITGIALLMDNFDFFEVGPIWRFWPLIFIAVGLGKLSDARVSSEYHSAAWWLFIGSWFLISELHIFGLHYNTSWPILLIGIGIGMVWKSIEYSHLKCVQENNHGH